MECQTTEVRTDRDTFHHEVPDRVDPVEVPEVITVVQEPEVRVLEVVLVVTGPEATDCLSDGVDRWEEEEEERREETPQPCSR